MRAGGGKKHGRYWFGNSLVDMATTPTLSQIRARSTSSSPVIRPRPDTTQTQIEAVKVISVSSVVPPFLHTFALNSHPAIKSFRPKWKQPFKHGRRRQRRGGGPSGTRCSKNWIKLSHICKAWARRWVFRLHNSLRPHLLLGQKLLLPVTPGL